MVKGNPVEIIKQERKELEKLRRILEMELEEKKKIDVEKQRIEELKRKLEPSGLDKVIDIVKNGHKELIKYIEKWREYKEKKYAKSRT